MQSDDSHRFFFLRQGKLLKRFEIGLSISTGGSLKKAQFQLCCVKDCTSTYAYQAQYAEKMFSEEAISSGANLNLEQSLLDFDFRESNILCLNNL